MGIDWHDLRNGSSSLQNPTLVANTAEMRELGKKESALFAVRSADFSEHYHLYLTIWRRYRRWLRFGASTFAVKVFEGPFLRLVSIIC